MGVVDDYRDSRKKAQVAFVEFMLHTRQKKDFLFCFFEGERSTDNPYYIPRIKRHVELYHPINCGGRERVLKVYELIRNHSEYDDYKKAFFIDRDFNEALQLNSIFETTCYSIENFYVSKNVFEEIIINSFQLSNEDFATCLTLFSLRQTEFHECTLLFNAWYSCLIDIRNKTGTQTGVNLSEKLPKGFLNFTLDEITSNYSFETILDTFPDAPFVSNEILEKKIEHFKTVIHHEVFRGKFELSFVLTFLSLIIRDSNQEKKYFKNKIKFIFGDSISNDQAINVFSAYAETPSSLNEYVASIIS